MAVAELGVRLLLWHIEATMTDKIDVCLRTHILITYTMNSVSVMSFVKYNYVDYIVHAHRV